ncbi:MAG TPA: SusC/RagA family TonB-linked outer membrane protein [Gemmatimonadaceae bacterium]|nr:SusC/RagA family TonB-linked outer membrane protein [Gemmatimonadaceae bacterium]
MLAVVVGLGLVPATIAAQQSTTITGRVMNDANAPATGVTVSIPELRVGTQTDPMGQYTFTAPATATGRTVYVIARRLGYQPDSAQVTLSGGTVTQNFTLRQSATQLTGVVVTALGIEREKSQLGTAQQQITSEDLNTTKAMNVVQQVQGKVSGVTITGGGTPGGSTNIVIRGQNTLASNNQPLFVVDGIPVANTNGGAGSLTNRGGGIGNGYDFGNAISDLNPEDIETFTVLKGPNAAAIYGSRAQNGAIVITTKKGMATQGRMRTELSTLYTWDAPGRLPDFQNQYGQGAGGSFSYRNGAGAGTCDGCDQSWGPKLDGRLLCQFNSPGAGTAGCTATPWVPQPNNVKDFFETGHTMSTTLAVSGGTDRANARMSVGVDNIDGFVPNNSFQKTTGLLSGQLQVSPRFTTNGVLQYVRNNGLNRPGTGYNNSIMEQFFWFGRQVDIDALRDWRAGSGVNGGAGGREYNWNYNYHNNPFFIQEANRTSDSRDRFIISGTARYALTDWLNASLRSGSDIFRFNIDQQFDPAFLNGTYVDQSYAGGFNFISDYRNEHNTELMLNANRNFMGNVDLTAMLGGNVRRETFDTRTTSTTGISVAGIYNVSNAAITPTLGQTITRRNMNSVFGSAAATLNNYWTVEVTGRNDVSSTLPEGENSYFYPSVNTSFIVTDAVPALQNNWLSYLKLRASWAEVGNDADPYQLATTFQGNANQFGGRPQFTLGNNLLEPNLKPEITNSTEGGIEVGFLNGRASLDMTVYRKETENQIYLVPVSPTTGYANKLINAGTMRNTGFEALLNVTPVEVRDFRWDLTFNYGQNQNKVVELAAGVDRIVLGNGLFSDVRVEATQGQPYGAIWGYDLRRCDGGAIDDGLCTTANLGQQLTSGGFPLQTDTMVYLGSIQPKWTGGLSNQFTWKNMSFGALLDIRRGGKLMSYTNYVGLYSGVLEESLYGREVDWNNPGVLVQGFDVDSMAANNITLTSERYHQSLFGATGLTTYDASYVKLRELRFGYDLPQNLANRVRMSSVSIALTGRNLALWTDVPNIDPEFAYSSGNFQGVEYALPGNTRSFGISLRVTP